MSQNHKAVVVKPINSVTFIWKTKPLAKVDNPNKFKIQIDTTTNINIVNGKDTGRCQCRHTVLAKKEGINIPIILKKNEMIINKSNLKS